MKNSLALLLSGLALIIWFCPSGQACTWSLVSPSVGRLTKKEASSRPLPLDLKKTVLKFYQLEMNYEFWTHYENLTRHCLKIKSFWSALQRKSNQITIACLQPTFA